PIRRSFAMRWFGPNLLDGSQRLNASCPLLASSLTIAAAKKHILEIRAQPHKTPSPSSFAGLAQVRDGFPGALPAARRHALDTFACPLELFWKLSSFWILTVKAESQVAENQENPEGERRKCRPASAQSSRVEPTGLGRLSAKDWPPKAPKWWSRTSPTARKPSAPSKRAGEAPSPCAATKRPRPTSTSSATPWSGSLAAATSWCTAP